MLGVVKGKAGVSVNRNPMTDGLQTEHLQGEEAALQA